MKGKGEKKNPFCTIRLCESSWIMRYSDTPDQEADYVIIFNALIKFHQPRSIWGETASHNIRYLCNISCIKAYTIWTCSTTSLQVQMWNWGKKQRSVQSQTQYIYFLLYFNPPDIYYMYFLLYLFFFVCVKTLLLTLVGYSYLIWMLSGRWRDKSLSPYLRDSGSRLYAGMSPPIRCTRP